MSNAFRIVAGSLDGKILLGRSLHRLEDNIRIDLYVLCLNLNALLLHLE